MSQLLLQRVMLKSLTSKVSQRHVLSSVSPFFLGQRKFSANASILADRLLSAYRDFGQFTANLDPLAINKPQSIHFLRDQKHAGLIQNDEDPNIMDMKVEVSALGYKGLGHNGEFSLKDIEASLKLIYSQNIGYVTSHIENEEEKQFFVDNVEGKVFMNEGAISPASKRQAFTVAYQSMLFDEYLGIKFGSFKRYGLEGGEAMMVAMDSLFHLCGSPEYKIDKMVIGMPHRGRLNLLVTALDLPARILFAKIKGQSIIPNIPGANDDVASHIGQTITKKFDKVNPLTVSLLNNSSHLEAANPISAGKTRAKIDFQKANNANPNVLNVQLHGDAAFAGQGIVTESLMMSHLPSFNVGGTVHIVVNNQIGFTTDPKRGRSVSYAGNIGKLISAPVLCVNGDNFEAVIATVRLAMAYRAKFHKDVIIDLFVYRKHGHNEVDEPSFTQPAMYKIIRSRQSPVLNYAQVLKQDGLITDEFMQKVKTNMTAHLDAELAAAATYEPSLDEPYYYKGKWQGFKPAATHYNIIQTGVHKDILSKVLKASIALPANFSVHPRLQRSHIEEREKMLESQTVDWAGAEALAIGSLMLDGHNVRFCGQDVERGTFSHRHAVLTDQNNEARVTPLNTLDSKGRFDVVNSHLSEEAVLAFEYGYSLESPYNFNIWEAQFGDFFNGAQIIIDAFIASSEAKWVKSTSLTMLLPHGYDGAGPEHSSCRIERFLQLSDDQYNFRKHNKSGNPVNLLVANPTTPSQYFHLLRRQQVSDTRKPLVIVAPKTLLRHAQAISSFDQMAPGTFFKSILTEPYTKDTTTLVFVTGKVYYEIDAVRKEKGNEVFAKSMIFVRIEELSPFPWDAIQEFIQPFINKMKRIVWFQEEPLNNGAATYVEPRLRQLINKVAKANHHHELEIIAREPSSSVATGVGQIHKKEIKQLLQALFTNGQGQ